MLRTPIVIGNYKVLTKQAEADDETASTKSSVSPSQSSQDVEFGAEREMARGESEYCVDCNVSLSPCTPAACDGKKYCDPCWLLWGMQSGPTNDVASEEIRDVNAMLPRCCCIECGTKLPSDAEPALDGKHYCNTCWTTFEFNPPAPLQAKRIRPKRIQNNLGERKYDGQKLLPTFGYAGSLDEHPPFAMFDIRDDVCLNVGGFRHGQVVRDNADGGRELVVVGVRPVDGELRLWFQPRNLGRPGAGAFPGASVGVLQERLYPVASLQSGRLQLNEASPQDFDEVEDADGEIMLLCRHCRLPVGDFVYADEQRNGHLHGECMAKCILDKEQEEDGARAKMDIDLKEKHRIEYGLGWKPEAIPSNLKTAIKLGCAVAPQGMCCLVFNEESRSVSIEETFETTGCLNLEYLTTALRVRLHEGTEPYFSLDPIAPKGVKAKRSNNERDHWMQVKRFEPEWLAGTSVGEILFQADYHLKELSMGEHEQPVVGMKSCVDVSNAEEFQKSWCAREWFIVKQAEVLQSCDNVLVPKVTMGIEAREQEHSSNGVEDKPITRPDHPLVKYAETFTHNFDLIAERKSVIHSLRELAKASVLAKFLMESDIYLEDSWFNVIGEVKNAYCQEVPQLWNERFFSKIQMENGQIVDADTGIDKCKHGVYGGVEFGLDQMVIGRAQKMAINIRAQLVAKPGKVGARVSGAARLQGVDLCLDKFDLTTSKSMEAETPTAGWGRSTTADSFWSSIDVAPCSEDEKLLKAIFNPSLSDRREEGDHFVPPETDASYVEGLRQLVMEEEEVLAQRMDAFCCREFMMSSPGPVFPSSWTPQFEIARNQSPGSGIGGVVFHMKNNTHANPVSFQELKSADVLFDKCAEDGTRFRIYRYNELEVRTIQVHEGEETIGVVFSLELMEGRVRLKRHEQEPIAKVVEYVEHPNIETPPKESWTRPMYCSYAVLETDQGNSIVTEQSRDGTVTWRVNPDDLEHRNFHAKVVRSADCKSGITIGELKAQQSEGSNNSESNCKRYAQNIYNSVSAGARQGDSSFWQQSNNSWRLLKTGKIVQESTWQHQWQGDCGSQWHGEWDNEWQGAWDGEWDAWTQPDAILPRKPARLIQVSTKVTRSNLPGNLGSSDQQVATYFKNKMQVPQRQRR